jgi:hypothetical protein
MQRLSLLLSLTVALASLAPVTASAVDIEDIDEEDGSKKKKKKDEAVLDSAEIIREIERGWYFKANAGVGDYIDRFGATLDLGSVIAVAVGNDFVDEPNRSMSYEFKFQQGVHNGMPYQEQPLRGVPPRSNIQGDTRTYALLASYRFAAFPSRRVGVGFQVGGGILFAPLLIEKGEFESVVVPAWGGNRPTVHETPHFPVFAGPTLEYYTKLSHFSIGIEGDFAYVVGFDMGFSGTGFMKYTF